MRLPPHPAQRVNRSKSVTFNSDGRTIPAYEGESVAAALYAAGVRTLSRSFKYHRPRGLLCAAGRCPNCLMQVDGEPNVRTCLEPVRQGMQVRGQHAWPSVKRDLLAAMGPVAGLLPVGFYYKTFIHPKKLWPLYEKVLRHLAALGTLDTSREPGRHAEHVAEFADVAVVGGGPAGVAAALEAARLGVDVLLFDDQPDLGGHLRWDLAGIEADEPGWMRARRFSERVRNEPRIRYLADATAFGLYEGRLLAVAHGDRLIKVRADRVVVATGGFEYPTMFGQNDLPGVLLGEASARLIAHDGVRPGRRAVVIANDGRGLNVAPQLLAAGIEIAAVADARPDPVPSRTLRYLANASVPVLQGYGVVEATGRGRVEGVVIARLDAGGKPIAGSERPTACDLLVAGAGWQPAAALLAQGDGRLAWRADLGGRYPADLPEWLFAAGEVGGACGLDAIERDGRLQGLRAALSLGAGGPGDRALAQDLSARGDEPCSRRALKGLDQAQSKCFVCLCEDVTRKDIADATAEGFDHVETLKRYTTATMGPCQGKMCHQSMVELSAAFNGRKMEDSVATTTRPPAQPVTLGVLAGPHHEPVRRTPMHHAHAGLEPTWMDMGSWKRPLVYRSMGSVEAECRAVHERVGLIDVSTLGKLEIKGKDAGAFLDWIHPNRFSDLKPGRVRYRLMLDDAGIIVDDGTVARLARDHFFLTTGSGALEAVEQWLTWWLTGGDRCVHVTDVTGALGAINVAGPRSRDLLSCLTDLDLSAERLPYMAAAEATVAGVPVLILRIGFVGELGYEMHFPAEYGEYLWETLCQAGREFDIAPFGVEAQRVLRLEKLHIIPGHDTDALSNPLEADMSWVVKMDKPDFVGRAALARLIERGLGQRLVGFELTTPAVPGEGDAVVANGQAVGRVTSAKWSPLLGRAIGLAWVPAAAAVDGSTFAIRSNGRELAARVATKPFYDPEGKRLRS